ncbi:MAG: hypothetical protein GWM98_09245, partial [Nitrospinaceae bacterium]|nr:hypothetical protein [Nitrospinaceae bacterium]NIR54643.1 hypothetical protein [Nitrospinaceae bacterium]NIS85060.1 hypothetical protein [Nitrospinaceae bacterium]NIT81877.1 hypothetical protein [Nitrospinaceae bacterium]NIU44141.1 hypothetical protein [Nitrospinaceae bacterium]
HGLNRRQGIASQVVARTTFLTGLILFFIPGIVLTFQSQQLTENFKHVSLVGMGVFTLLIFLFFLFQLSVSLRHVTAMLSRFSGKEGFQSVL